MEQVTVVAVKNIDPIFSASIRPAMVDTILNKPPNQAHQGTSRARQTVENRGLRDFKIRQPQDRLGDSSFGFASLYLFHDPWPPPPRVDHAPASQQVQSGWRVIRPQQHG